MYSVLPVVSGECIMSSLRVVNSVIATVIVSRPIAYPCILYSLQGGPKNGYPVLFLG